jgi:hypothetical protein
MNDLVSEYQQYQDATAEEENEADEEEAEAWFTSYKLFFIIIFCISKSLYLIYLYNRFSFIYSI